MRRSLPAISSSSSIFSSGWLQDLHLHHVKLYALVAIVLIIGQAVLLESVTTWLFRFLRGRSE